MQTVEAMEIMARLVGRDTDDEERNKPISSALKTAYSAAEQYEKQLGFTWQEVEVLGYISRNLVIIKGTERNVNNALRVGLRALLEKLIDEKRR